ncbi:MAG: UDP-N-acetylglucosamine 2-epimerase (hydrolyzing) [Acidobacteriaceae bacterium]|nr:UDP-N-acetylglucosamine 2-epimerase (hydrolyzing) [Acidobacteriaceae bacterium]
MNANRRKICVVLVDRANYGRLKPVMKSIQAHPALELQIVVAGTMVLARFGQPVDIVRRDGFEISGEIYLELEGSTPTTMAKSVGFGVLEFANEFQRLKPDIVLLIGDRYEAVSAAIAAAYMNLCIAHVQGGEVSGSIDESARHAITKFAHFHFPSTVRSAEYLVRMGERRSSILGIGCPSSDIAREMNRTLDAEMVNSTGSGAIIDVAQPYLLVAFHPTTTRYGGELEDIHELLAALDSLKHQTILLWPNIDAGSDNISKAVRIFRDRRAPSWLRTVTNLTPETYLRVLAHAACAVGNSSSFVRDASYFGTPVVITGERQRGREHDVHVVHSSIERGRLLAAIRAQVAHGRYEPSKLYGDGHVSERIADALASARLYVQKTLDYVSIQDSDADGGFAGEYIITNIGNHYGARGIEGNSAQEYSSSIG